MTQWEWTPWRGGHNVVQYETPRVAVALAAAVAAVMTFSRTRVKAGRNALLLRPFKAVRLFRPGLIWPSGALGQDRRIDSDPKETVRVKAAGGRRVRMHRSGAFVVGGLAVAVLFG